MNRGIVMARSEHSIVLTMNEQALWDFIKEPGE